MAGLPTGGLARQMRRDDDGGTTPMSPTHAALVVRRPALRAAPAATLQDGCRRLALLLGVPLLQVGLCTDRPGRVGGFVNASGAVDFRIGGKPLARDARAGVGEARVAA